MTLDELLQALRALDAVGIARARAVIDAAHATVADEVATWEELIALDQRLRHRGRGRDAALAAHRAAEAVRAAALAAGIALPDPAVTCVAREAAALARALVAADGSGTACPRLTAEAEALARLVAA